MIGAVTGRLRIDDKPCLLSPFQTSALERIQLPFRVESGRSLWSSRCDPPTPPVHSRLTSLADLSCR